MAVFLNLFHNNNLSNPYLKKNLIIIKIRKSNNKKSKNKFPNFLIKATTNIQILELLLNQHKNLTIQIKICNFNSFCNFKSFRSFN